MTMLKYIFVPGLQYEGETDEQMAAREAAMIENNRLFDEPQADWRKQRELPMPAMRRWYEARRHLLPTANQPF